MKTSVLASSVHTATQQTAVLQRKCACGGASGPTGQCAECRRKRKLGVQTRLRVNEPGDKYEQEADRIASHILDPSFSDRGVASVHVAPLRLQRLSKAKGIETGGPSGVRLPDDEEEDEEELSVQMQAVSGAAPAKMSLPTVPLATIQQGGRPLDGQLRAYFESRFGHRFDAVRVHTSEPAAALAEQLHARAFTLGRHIVFGKDEYDPHSTSGRQLLAHELTHVLQQRSGAMRSVQREELSESEAPPADGGIPTPDVEPAAEGGDKKPVCEPGRALTWADFAGSPPSGATYDAETKYTFPKASGTPTSYRAVFDGSGSWGKPRWTKPTDRNVNGCKPPIASCKKWLKKNPGGTWSFDGTPDAKCPASPVADPSIEAATIEECDSKIGAECDRVAELESTRLLKHEQLHFTIGCVLVKKANAAIAAGTDAATAKSKLDSVDKTVTTEYDNKTNHGCKAAEQSSWETEVGKGLPAITIP